MKLYCLTKEALLENGQLGKVIVEGPRELPVCTENISNFNAADDEFVKTYGWLPVETRSEGKEIIVSSSFEILEDKIVEQVITRDRDDQEKWSSIRKQRDQLLSESDKLVLIDRWLVLSAEQQKALTDYRQSLRDIPSNFVSPDDVIYPTI